MNDSQDIFLLLLLTLFMSNNDADYQNINSTLISLLLFGTFENRNQIAANTPAMNAAAYNAAYNQGLFDRNARVNRNACGGVGRNPCDGRR